ncbi:MAG: glyoxalase [bacterium]|nr:glyoxalase [bacterium]
MQIYDNAVLDAFLEKQGQLFPERVAETRKEAEEFLEDCMAVVVDSAKEVWEYFDEEGIDVDGAKEQEILGASEVFAIDDGRYLIVEG